MNDREIQEYVDTHDWYAPIDLGGGIVTRPSDWPDAPPDTPQMGISRFHFILSRNLPNLQGKRVLDLGCNAGIISLQMARCGAREVVGIDSDRTWKGWLEQAHFVKEVLQWRCAASYNVRYIDADMRDLPSLTLGTFDVVVALCCFYYLPDDDMARLTRFLADNTGTFLVQGNTVRADHRSLPEIKRRAHPRFLANVLRANGFPFIEVDAPWGYGRPVVVGRQTEPVSRYRSRLAQAVAGLVRRASYLPWMVELRLRKR